MDSIIANALSRTGGQPQDNISSRFRLESTSGSTFSNVDYYKLAEQEFGFSLKKASIAVFGCGGAGQNAVTRLTEMGVEGARTVSLNTDAKHLAVGKADKKILIGKELTRGLGAGGFWEVGKKAAEESRNEIKEMLEGEIQRMVTAAEITNYAVKNDDGQSNGKKPLILEYTLKNTGLLESAGNKFLLKIGDVIGPQFELYSETERTLPVHSDYKRIYTRKIKFTVPEGYRIANMVQELILIVLVKAQK